MKTYDLINDASVLSCDTLLGVALKQPTGQFVAPETIDSILNGYQLDVAEYGVRGTHIRIISNVLRDLQLKDTLNHYDPEYIVRAWLNSNLVVFAAHSELLDLFTDLVSLLDEIATHFPGYGVTLVLAVIDAMFSDSEADLLSSPIAHQIRNKWGDEVLNEFVTIVEQVVHHE